MMYIFDLHALHHVSETTNNADRSAFFDCVDDGNASVCSETRNRAVEMGDGTKELVQSSALINQKNSEDDFIFSAGLAAKFPSLNSLKADEQQRYAYIVAQAMRLGATIVTSEVNAARFSIVQLCNSVGCPCMNFASFVASMQKT